MWPGGRSRAGRNLRRRGWLSICGNEDLLQPTMDEIDAIAFSGGLAGAGLTEPDGSPTACIRGEWSSWRRARAWESSPPLGWTSCSHAQASDGRRHLLAGDEQVEIVMRPLSAEAKLSDMRSGRTMTTGPGWRGG